MIVRELIPIRPTSTEDVTIIPEVPLAVSVESKAMFGVQLRLPDVTLTVNQKVKDGVWAFFVSVEGEGTIERFGPERDKANDD